MDRELYLVLLCCLKRHFAPTVGFMLNDKVFFNFTLIIIFGQLCLLVLYFMSLVFDRWKAMPFRFRNKKIPNLHTLWSASSIRYNIYTSKTFKTGNCFTFEYSLKEHNWHCKFMLPCLRKMFLVFHKGGPCPIIMVQVGHIYHHISLFFFSYWILFEFISFCKICFIVNLACVDLTW